MKNKVVTISLIQLIIILGFLTFPLSCQSDETTITIGNGSGLPGTQNNQVEISLQNPNDKVKGIQIDVCDVDDYLSCSACETIGRASEFSRSFNELENGCVRIILFSFTGDLIDEGTGSILNLIYDVSEEAPAGECRNLNLENIQIADENENLLEAEVIQGTFCFGSNSCVIKELYGDNSDEAYLLREYRDKVLSKTPEGQEIISTYYQWSPVIVRAMEKDEEFKEDMKELIDVILVLIRTAAE